MLPAHGSRSCPSFSDKSYPDGISAQSAQQQDFSADGTKIAAPGRACEGSPESGIALRGPSAYPPTDQDDHIQMSLTLIGGAVHLAPEASKDQDAALHVPHDHGGLALKRLLYLLSPQLAREAAVTPA